jgi:Ser/Thr protein kinase RdoA (MazF antagonist)
MVLRCHRPGYRAPDETRSELLFLRALPDLPELAVPRPVATHDGELLVLIPVMGKAAQPTIHCDLLAYLDGSVYRPGNGLGRRRAQRLGVALGTLHRQAETFVPPPGFRLPAWDAEGMFTASSPFRPGPLDEIFKADDRRLFEELAMAVRDVFQQLGQKTNESGIIHADFILGNCQWQGRTVQILDFDDCGWRYFLYDLAPLLGNFADYPQGRALRRAFLEGYRTVRPLPAVHEQYLDLLIAARHATSCLWVAGCHRNGGLGPEPAEHIAYRMSEIRRILGEIL